MITDHLPRQKWEQQQTTGATCCGSSTSSKTDSWRVRRSSCSSCDWYAMGLYSACAISDSTHKSRCNVIAQHLRSFWHHRQVTSQYDCTALALFLTPQTSHVAMRLYSACTLSDSTDKSRCNGIVQCLRYFWQHRQVTLQCDCTALAIFLTPQTSHITIWLHSACAISDTTDKSRRNTIVHRLHWPSLGNYYGKKVEMPWLD